MRVLRRETTVYVFAISARLGRTSKREPQHSNKVFITYLGLITVRASRLTFSVTHVINLWVGPPSPLRDAENAAFALLLI